MSRDAGGKCPISLIVLALQNLGKSLMKGNLEFLAMSLGLHLNIWQCDLDHTSSSHQRGLSRWYSIVICGFACHHLWDEIQNPPEIQ